METILITGASSGMGREMAIQFSEQYKVIVNGRNHERLQETISLCHNSDQHFIWQYDLSNIDGLEESLTAHVQLRGSGLRAEKPLCMISLFY